MSGRPKVQQALTETEREELVALTQRRKTAQADRLIWGPGITEDSMPFRTTLRPIAIAMLTAGLAACGGARQAADAPAGPQQCFDAGAVTSFQPVDRETVLLQVSGSRAYELKITGVCPDINWSGKIGIAGEDGGSTICTGRDVTLITPSPRGGSQECFANEIRVAP